jgi:hypothetical protein
VQWTERWVRAVWRSLRTSNRYTLLQPDEPVTPRPNGPCRTTMQNAGGRESKQKQEALKGDRAAMAAMLASAARMPDLLAMRRRAWEGRLVRRAWRRIAANAMHVGVAVLCEQRADLCEIGVEMAAATRCVRLRIVAWLTCQCRLLTLSHD